VSVLFVIIAYYLFSEIIGVAITGIRLWVGNGSRLCTDTAYVSNQVDSTRGT